MPDWRQQQRATDFLSVLIEGGNRLIKRKPVTLESFLAALDATEPTALLATPDGQRDALAHLAVSWSATVSTLARPETLPAVVERRSRARIYPVAPWLTAGVAGVGSAVMVAGSRPALLESFGVVAVVGCTALASRWLWRPRMTRKDRKFTVTGASALASRAQTLASQQSVGDPTATRTTDRLLSRALGYAHDVEETESAAVDAGLLDPAGEVLAGAPLSPAHRRLVEDVVLQRAELVRTLLHLQRSVLQVREEDRRMRREEYHRIVDDLNE